MDYCCEYHKKRSEHGILWRNAKRIAIFSMVAAALTGLFVYVTITSP